MHKTSCKKHVLALWTLLTNTFNFIEINVGTPCSHMACHIIIRNWVFILVVISHKSKWYFWILNFESFKYIDINSIIIIYLPKNWTSCHIDYSHKTMMPHGISWYPLQLHSNICDQVVINIVKKTIVNF